MQKTVVNLQTGDSQLIDLTAEEIAEREAMQPTPEQLLQQKRAAMVLTPAQARIKLAELGLLATINAAIFALEETHIMRIYWEYGTEIHRLNPYLIEFCTATLAMTDEQIDGWFV